MGSIRRRLQAIQARRRVRRATLPWAELEAEAARQGCSPADVFYDRAGRPVPGLPVIAEGPQAADPTAASDALDASAGPRLKPTYDTWGRRT